MRVIIEPEYETAAKWTANYIVKKINEFDPSGEKPFVLGLPTGSSPIGVYDELARLCKAGQISFKHVITFNMD